MKIRTVIVDDEPLGRARIVKLLEDYTDIRVVAQCRNGREAIETIRATQPDLVFLDIQMPDMSGFSVLARLDLANHPMVVFATAYDAYALKAFDVHAIDYLLKPFDKHRFREAVERATTQIELEKSSEFNSRLLRLLGDYQRDHEDDSSSFCIKQGGRLVTVPATEVYWIEADGNYVVLHTHEQNYLYRSTMNAIEIELEPSIFLRIHRSYMVNTTFIKNVRYTRANEYRFLLVNDEELSSSRSYKSRIVDALDQIQFQR